MLQSKPRSSAPAVRSAELIAVGSELILGYVAERNCAFLARELTRLGLAVRYATTVGDDEQAMAETLERAIARSGIVIMTGGLGATEDDLTRKVLAKVTRRRLILNEELRDRIHARYRERGAPIPAGAERQALVLSRAHLIDNALGTAPGIQVSGPHFWLAALPGVPHEMEAMFHAVVSGLLQVRFGLRPLSRLRVVRCGGITESAVNERLRPLFPEWPGSIGMIARPGGVDVWLLSGGRRGSLAIRSRRPTELDELAALEREVRLRLGEAVFGVDEESLELVTGRLLHERGVTLAVAESCTGGLVTHLLTNVPGSSEYVDRSVICYSNRSKSDLVGVAPPLIEEYGAVSAQVAWAMADGARRTSGCSLGLAVTGIAGPTGGSVKKPVGLVHLAVSDQSTVTTQFHHFHGDRTALKQAFALAALDLLRRHLLKTAV
ncbi:MAG TPA: CinA family nicotinamide mononucleotide deamidase-related protein [Nitrospiria bacterium]|nr:CinA family nicotinamide mononucleotide deamidase-related protein [Nitrospiria bacterium]